jgi:UMF1 family MFS transporter
MTLSPSRNKAIASWILYDVGSSGYIFLIPGITYAIFFREQVCGGGTACDGQWGLLVSLTLLLAGILAPLIGAIADLGRLRHRLFTAMTLLCALGCLSLITVQPGAMVWGMMAFALTQAGYLLATSLYDAYLPELGTEQTLGRLSGWGWGLGYIGGIICYVLFRAIESSERFNAVTESRLAFLIAGIWVLALCLPALLWLPRQTPTTTNPPIRQSYRQVWQTFKSLPQRPHLLKFLIGFYLISDAIITINNFLGIYLTTQFALTLPQILQYGVLFNLVSIPATIFFGYLGDRLSTHQILYSLLLLWGMAVTIMVFSTNPATPLVLAILLGLVFGSTQAFCRGWFARLIQINQATELFGFNALAGRLAAILGPLLFGVISSLTGDQRLAMGSLALFLGVGTILLSQVPSSNVASGIKNFDF